MLNNYLETRAWRIVWRASPQKVVEVLNFPVHFHASSHKIDKSQVSGTMGLSWINQEN